MAFREFLTYSLPETCQNRKCKSEPGIFCPSCDTLLGVQCQMEFHLEGEHEPIIHPEVVKSVLSPINLTLTKIQKLAKELDIPLEHKNKDFDGYTEFGDEFKRLGTVIQDAFDNLAYLSFSDLKQQAHR